MERKSRFSITPKKLLKIFLVFSIIEGLFVFYSVFQVQSDINNALFFGFSLRRLIIGWFTLAILGILLLIFIDSYRPLKFMSLVGKKLILFLENKRLIISVQTSLILIFFSLTSVLLVYFFPGFQRFYPFIKGMSIIQAIGERGGVFLLIWISLLICRFIILNYLYLPKNTSHIIDIQEKANITFWVSTVFFAFLYLIFTSLGSPLDAGKFIRLSLTFLIFSLWFTFWIFLKKHVKWVKNHTFIFECVSIWLVYFLMSLNIALWFNSLAPTDRNAFNQLAESFINGKLYLENPIQTYDLTPYNGKWYVPFPPFPSILMLPFIFVFGISGVNTTIFSISVASSSAVIVYWLLIQMKKFGWISLGKVGRGWLVALFSIGTVHWWLSLESMASFFSQVVTILFIALSFLSVMKKSPPWLTGLFLAGAILSRPNTFVIWPALVAIYIQIEKDVKININWLNIMRWCIFSVIPIILSVTGLLFYNFVRFENFFDFGYETVNGADWILENVQTYGVFHPHFIPNNLHWMFVGLSPKLISQCDFFFPRGNGMSIFITSPAFIYLFRKFKLSWWTAGCWLSIFLSIIMLSMYHNNGAIQISYRYVMDFAVPIIMLLGITAGKRISILLKLLIVLSIIINYYGIISWFSGPC